MKLSPKWLREFVDVPVDDRKLAADLTDVGAAVEGISGEGENTVFEMEITTNRPDLMNHYGVAREAAAIYGKSLKTIHPELLVSNGTRTGMSAPHKAAPHFSIEIEDAEGCARYTARIICDTNIVASPSHIARRLELMDQRPINNAADASNYTLWEMGHPTHAFDLDLLEGGKIIVRRARAGEMLKTLDAVDRKLTADDLVIADAVKPVALAGVMGGFDTMITEKTHNILIESAWFDPVTVRKTARRHGLHTDASHRFERGADFAATAVACARVAQRILESGGGHLQGEEIDVLARPLDQAPIALRLGEVQRILGCHVDAGEIVRILEKLGFGVAVEREDDAEFTVHVPSWRLDVEREIDLIEEIARLHGYNNFPNTLPAYAGGVVELPDAAKDNKLRSILLGSGYNEAVSLTFISSEDAKKFSSAPAVKLANPLSEEASIMRTSMVPGMLNMLAYNLNRDIDRVRLFEAGNIFEATGESRKELKRICLGATVEAIRKEIPIGGTLHASKGENVSALEVFRSFKGDIENLLRPFEYEDLYYDGNTPDYYHPGRAARAVMNGATVAHFGELHPDVKAARKLRQEVYIGEIYLDRLYHHDLRRAQYRALGRYPAVERDFSFIFDDAVAFERVENAVDSLQIGELRKLQPIEIFRGGAVSAGSYSILLRVTFQSTEHTLREEEVAEWSKQIIRTLEGLGGTLRAS